MTATWCLRHNSLLGVQREVPPEVTCVMKVEEEKKTEMGVGRERKGEEGGRTEGGRDGKTEFVISAFSELAGCYCR